MNKIYLPLYAYSLAAMLCLSLLLSCTPDIELIPELEYSSSSGTSSSNVVVMGSSSSLLSSSSYFFVISSSSRVSSSSVAISSSSSSLVPSSSSVLAYNYCVFLEEKICLLGPMTSCPSGGVLSNNCPYGSSSSTQPPSNSSSSSNLSSSSSVGSSGLCAGFVDGTTREHYGKNKAQFCDSRDGKKYVYVTIGDQVWMAENLNYEASGSKCYNNEPANCTTYGRLYNWATRMTLPASCNSSSCASQVGVKHKGICPSNWHIPSDADWNVLMKYAIPSCSENSYCAGAGPKLKATSGWNSNRNGTDDFGFAALPSGAGGSDGSFGQIGYHNYLSSSLEVEANTNEAYGRGVAWDNEYLSWFTTPKDGFIGVRCVHD